MYDLVLAVSLFLFCNLTLGLFQRYAPDSLPKFLRRKTKMIFQVHIAYNFFGERHDYYFDMLADNENDCLQVVKHTIDNNQFFPGDKELIPVCEIKHVSVSRVLDADKKKHV